MVKSDGTGEYTSKKTKYGQVVKVYSSLTQEIKTPTEKTPEYTIKDLENLVQYAKSKGWISREEEATL